MITRKDDGQKTEDYQAFLALRGMSEGGAAVEIEKEYHRWLGVSFNDDGLLNNGMGRLARLKYFAMRKFKPFELFRIQVAFLARDLQRARAQAVAAAQQQSEAQNYILIAKEVRDLHKFLYAHFQEDCIIAEAANKSNFQLAKEIMLRGAGKLPASGLLPQTWAMEAPRETVVTDIQVDGAKQTE